jgi:hypothetical protein
MNVLLLTLAFLLELVAFGSFAAVGFLMPVSFVWQCIIALILFILFAVFWGIFMSPRAPKKFSPVVYYVAKATLYTVSAYVLFVKTPHSIAISFIILSILDDVFLYKHNLQTKR